MADITFCWTQVPFATISPLLDSSMEKAKSKFLFPPSLIDGWNRSSGAFSEFCLLPAWTAGKCSSHFETKKIKITCWECMRQKVTPWTLVMFGLSIRPGLFPMGLLVTWVNQFFCLLSHCGRFFCFLEPNTVLIVIPIFFMGSFVLRISVILVANIFQVGHLSSRLLMMFSSHLWFYAYGSKSTHFFCNLINWKQKCNW